ncbi:N-6 DNA methylase [Sapientia aquatica]|uniref:site-specific DNA-methyltransferase (adenine-specific) n=1 Tax=Sapientia aquatica TaxID=1549640 RepID=A0A4R5VRT0_9BURK|nr:N-6 DNA methylase [Sapientia aquatica]TDK61193.1 hypothetical protein E2I14_17530 [Sapientia aquatica]
MNDKILLQLMDIFRNEADLNSNKGAIFSLLFLAWHKASETPNCPANLQMKNCQAISPDDLVETMNRLNSVTSDAAFAINLEDLARLKQLTVSAAISKCLSMSKSGLLDEYDPTDAVHSFNSLELPYPEDVCDLLVDLAGNIANEEVYLPWESNGQLTGRILKKKAKAMVEAKWHSPVPILVSSILSGGDQFHYAYNDPLTNPHYVKNGQLRIFTTTIARLPFGASSRIEYFEHDLFDRFKEKTRSIDLLLARHILAQTKGRAILTAMNSLLFSSGAERSFREDLLNRQQIEAVIAMPPRLLNDTAIPFAILILNNEKRCETVRFVNADTPRFAEAISRTKSRLINLDALVETILNTSECSDARNVSTQEILANDAQLQVGRYVLGATEQKVARLLETTEVRPLDEIAMLVKPMANSNSENGISIYEIGAADLPDYGFIGNPKKQLQIEFKAEKMKGQFLRPNDIVLIIKGNLGKVGIVPDGIPPPGANGWIAGQSSAVIRVTDTSQIDPRALFMLLRSQLGKELVKSLASGSAIPFVQLRELKNLRIPVPSKEESDDAIKILQEEDLLQHKINELLRQQVSLSENCWSLDSMEIEK